MQRAVAPRSLDMDPRGFDPAIDTRPDAPARSSTKASPRAWTAVREITQRHHFDDPEDTSSLRKRSPPRTTPSAGFVWALDHTGARGYPRFTTAIR